ncbi:MAG: TIGR02677 family protein [Mycobacteriaceae bacterium]
MESHPGLPELQLLLNDERLRLFSFANADKRADYLQVLRTFDLARTNYVVLLHAGQVADSLSRSPGKSEYPLTAQAVAVLLEQLHQWGVLERSYDGSRAATLADYRNRHYVYQFSQGGYRAFRAVEEVLTARLDDVSLSRLVLPEILEDLAELARANQQGDSELVYRKLSRLDTALTEMANRAAQFYLSLGDLVRTTDLTPETFLAHKDTLLAHMREFSSDLARYAPRLSAAISNVEATGIDQLVNLAAAADERLFLEREELLSDWRGRWIGLSNWFAAPEGGTSETDRLRDGTMSAISAVLSLLRRVTDARRGGVSRDSQLRHLASWFAATPTQESAHALFGLVFGLNRPRHLSMLHPDADVIPYTRSWWEAPAVELSRTLVETGRTPNPGLPTKVQRNEGGLRKLREQQLATQRARQIAAQSLAKNGVSERTLNEQETEVLLSLLNVALAARVRTSGRVNSTSSEAGVQLTLTPAAHSTQVSTVRGVLHLDRLAVTVQ